MAQRATNGKRKRNVDHDDQEIDHLEGLVKYIKLGMYPQKVVRSLTKMKEPNNSKNKAKRGVASTNR